MAGCKKKHSKLQESNYNRYAAEGKAGINRLARMVRELKKNPNNTQLAEQIKKGNTGYTRKKPVISILTNATKAAMQNVKYFAGKGNKELISNIFLTHSAAWRKLIDIKKQPKANTGKKKYGIMSIGGNLPDQTLKLLEV